jgi:twitching motility protein PilT
VGVQLDGHPDHRYGVTIVCWTRCGVELNEILTLAIQSGASDIHLKAGLPPMFRIDGRLGPQPDGKRLSPEDIGRMAAGIMNNFQREKFKDENEIDLAYGVPGMGRFRVNVFMQRGTVGGVFRVIPFKIMTIEQLNLPKVLEKIATEERGLILVTGTTGSGKSTSLAAMIDFINTNRTCHILTVEDPIEFLIRDKRSVVNQREVGVDTKSFSRALKSALREDPDVILVGEMRDLETIEIAMTAAETGHLVMSTLHTLDAPETITRIVSAFPPYQQKQVRLQLASILKAVISQRLVPRADGKGRVAAVEVLRSTARVRELIEDKERTKELHDAIADGVTSYGMQSFDQSLMGLLTGKLITYEEALRQATNPDDFALRVSGIGGTSDGRWDSFDGSGASSRPGMPTTPPTTQPPLAAALSSLPPVQGRAMPSQPPGVRLSAPPAPVMGAASPFAGLPAQPRPGTTSSPSFPATRPGPTTQPQFPAQPAPITQPPPAQRGSMPVQRPPSTQPQPAPGVPGAPDFEIERF